MIGLAEKQWWINPNSPCANYTQKTALADQIANLQETLIAKQTCYEYCTLFTSTRTIAL